MQATFLDEKLKSLNIKMIAVDRPGYGESDWIQPENWRVAADQYLKLLKAEGFEKLFVMGVSGGAPMAHMVTSYYGDLVTKLVIVCGLASLSKTSSFTFSRNQKRLLKLAHFLPVKLTQNALDFVMTSLLPEKRLSHLIKNLHESDKRVLSLAKHQETLLKAMKWARTQKSKGVVWDAKIFSGDWLTQYCENLELPIVYFHGDQDFLLNPEMSVWMSSQRAKSKLVRLPGQGHYAIAFEDQDKILAEIKSPSFDNRY